MGYSKLYEFLMGWMKKVEKKSKMVLTYWGEAFRVLGVTIEPGWSSIRRFNQQETKN